MLRICLAALPALSLVLPARNSEPVSAHMLYVGLSESRVDGRVLVIVAVRQLRSMATLSAPTTNGVLPDAEIPMTVSFNVK